MMGRLAHTVEMEESMHPSKVHRDRLDELTDLPNIGPRIATCLFKAGIDRPADLKGRDAFELYRQLCDSEGERLDPCVLDVCLSITRFMDGEEPRVWWHYTAERKRRNPEL
jgi:hypothetical protein